MSAAAARRRKQLAARQDVNAVETQLTHLLSSQDIPEERAYEALQLAQSSVRKKVTTGDYEAARALALKVCLQLLQKGRVAVASQLLDVLVTVLMETHADPEPWLSKLVPTLTDAHAAAMEESSSSMPAQERVRLWRLQKEWLMMVWKWSSLAGTVRMGHVKIHEALAEFCWSMSQNLPKDDDDDDDDDKQERAELQWEAVQHWCLAEQPDRLFEVCLKTLPAPTPEQTKQGHTCPPALRDVCMTRALLLWATVQNLRDANHLMRRVTTELYTTEEVEALRKSYTSKDDGQAPSHVMFGCMLLRILEKDMRTGPLFSWLMRSFKRELDGCTRACPNAPDVQSYVTKIGKVYFNIQPPPNMLNMMENMMNMMGGAGGGAGGMPPINPAMMQAAMAQMQQGGMMK